MNIKNLLFASLLVALLPFAVRMQNERGFSAARQPELMPLPVEYRSLPQRLGIASSFQISVQCQTPDERLTRAAERAARQLERLTNLTFAHPTVTNKTDAALLIYCQTQGKTIPTIDENESYALEVSATQAILRAPTGTGAMRGLETFLQLLEGDAGGFFIPGAVIRDEPRFRWRGLLIDVSRHFEPIESLKKHLDAMALVKLNVFHWHLTDDQGFRIESRKFPKLHGMGSDGFFYTQEQVKEIIKYAAERGIRVVPEFDMPGHTTSWLVGYPEMGSAPGPYQIERKFGILEPALDPTREEVYQFIDTFLGEMAALFPDEYLHIGGDEVTGKHWDANPQIQAFMKAKGIKDHHALQTYFNQRLSEIVKKHGKKMVGWDEILHPGLPQGVVIQSWRGQSALADAVRSGYQGILSAGYYIDLMGPASEHYLVDPINEKSGQLSEAQAARILGGEIASWGEYVNADTRPSRIWPRAAAIAERFWSPRTVTDVDDMYRRLANINLLLEEQGLGHLSYSDKILRLLSRSEDIGPLKTMVALLEPSRNYGRTQTSPRTTQLTPLTRLIDATPPESDEARRISALSKTFLEDAPRFSNQKDSLIPLFDEWRRVCPQLNVLTERSPALREAQPLVKDLDELARIGAEAVWYLSSQTEPPTNWREKNLQSLEQAAKPKAELVIAVTPAVARLVIAAAERRSLATMSKNEWEQRIANLFDEWLKKNGNKLKFG